MVECGETDPRTLPAMGATTSMSMSPTVRFLFLLRSVLLFTFPVHVRSPQAAFGRKMPDEVNDVPHLLVLQYSFPGRHSTVANPVFDDPFQLAIRVRLDVLHSQIRNGRVHSAGEWHSAVLPIQSMADLAMMLKVHGAGLHA